MNAKEAVMDKIICDNYVAILKNELIASFGCTEPIVIAYASAKAREVLGEDVVKLELLCSGNVIKNVKSVIVPNSDGERGIPIAAALGALGGDASQQLEVLSAITPEKILQAKAFVAAGKCTYDLIPGVPNLYVAVTATGEHHTAKVVLKRSTPRSLRSAGTASSSWTPASRSTWQRETRISSTSGTS